MSRKKATFPRWRMPAEWTPHEATWLAWPHNRDDWPGKFTPIPWVYAEIIRHLHVGEKIHLLVNDAATEARVRRILGKVGVDLGQIRFFRWPTDRVWTRDYGPIFVKSENGDVGITDWKFNAWAKYANWKKDNAIPGKVARTLKLASRSPTLEGKPVVLEGGSIDVNGEGLLLTTEECLLSPIQARNPGLTREEIEQVFGEYLGIEKVLWLGNGIAGDDTHGHVDDITRFVAADTVVTAVETNANDANYRPLQENLERLRGTKLQVVELPMPAPLAFDGQRLPASYANFYIGNACVLMPTFNDPNDRIALGVLAELFPGRQVIGVHAVDLVWGLGTLHCMTQQQPAV